MFNRIQPVGKHVASTSGMSLLEVLVAVAFLGISLITLISLGSTGLQSAGTSRNEALADQYAREGVDMLRSYRDNMGWDALRKIGGFSDNHPVWGGPYYGTSPTCTITNADRYYVGFLLPASGVATPVVQNVRSLACGSEAMFANSTTYQHKWLNSFCETSTWMTQPAGSPTILQAQVVPNFYRLVILGFETQDRAFIRSIVCYSENTVMRGIQVDSYLTNWR